MQDLDYVFQQLTSGLNNIRQALGEERYNELLRMSERMRALLVSTRKTRRAKLWRTLQDHHRMEDILRQVQRKV